MCSQNELYPSCWRPLANIIVLQPWHTVHIYSLTWRESQGLIGQKRLTGQTFEEPQLCSLVVSTLPEEKWTWGWEHCLPTLHQSCSVKPRNHPGTRDRTWGFFCQVCAQLHLPCTITDNPPATRYPCQDIWNSCHFHQFLSLSCAKLPASVI